MNAKERLLAHIDAHDGPTGISEEALAETERLVSELRPHTPVPAPMDDLEQVEGRWETLFAYFGAKHSAGKPKVHDSNLKIHSFNCFPPVPVRITRMCQEIARSGAAYNNVVEFTAADGKTRGVIIVHGRFRGEQRALYELVLAAQEAAVAVVAPGVTADQVHDAAVRVLVEGLRDLGLLVGEVDGLIEQGAYRHLYMHRTGHWLGLDVHDVGAYRLGEHPVVLEPGMVLTVEPGLYVSDRLAVPEGQPAIEERWKGIGIRIEDDVAVSEHGHEVLTAAALKAPAAMER